MLSGYAVSSWGTKGLERGVPVQDEEMLLRPCQLHLPEMTGWMRAHNLKITMLSFILFSPLNQGALLSSLSLFLSPLSPLRTLAIRRGSLVHCDWLIVFPPSMALSHLPAFTSQQQV